MVCHFGTFPVLPKYMLSKVHFCVIIDREAREMYASPQNTRQY